MDWESLVKHISNYILKKLSGFFVCFKISCKRHLFISQDITQFITFSKKITIKEDEIYLLLVGLVVVPELTPIVSEIEKEFGREINYTVMTDDEFAFRKKNNDPFIWRFLKQPKVMLVGVEEELLK